MGVLVVNAGGDKIKSFSSELEFSVALHYSVSKRQVRRKGEAVPQIFRASDV
jgi:hypothetical protein